MEKERVSLLGPRGASLGLVEIILGQFANILGPQSSSGFGVYTNAFRLVDLSVFFLLARCVICLHRFPSRFTVRAPRV